MTIRVHTTEGFSHVIEEMMERDDIDILDAILTHCEAEGIEYGSVGKLLTPKLKKMLAEQARGLNMLKRDDAC